MKRSYFLKQLAVLPFGPFFVQKLWAHMPKRDYLLNKFYVAGFQYHNGPDIIDKITINESLKLVAEPQNQYDPFAVGIYHHNAMIGFVPRSDNKHISRLLQQGVGLACKAKKVNPEKDTWKMLKVEVYL